MGRRALVLLVALLLAGVAAFAVWTYIQNYRDTVDDQRQKITIYRASQEIPEGQDGSIFFQTPMWVESEDETSDIPQGAITSEQQLNAVVSGKVAVGPIAENEILTEGQWVELSVDITPLAEQIPSGKQALTISTDQVRGVNGFIQPGDRINAIMTLDIQFDILPEQAPGFGVPDDGATDGEEGTAEEEEESETVTLTRYVLQGLPVLAVDRDVRPQEGETPDVPDVAPAPEGEGAATGEATEPEVPATVFTIEVDPEQAQRLVYAFENGSVWLTLVPEDFVAVDTAGITINNLFAGDLVDDIFGG